MGRVASKVYRMHENDQRARWQKGIRRVKSRSIRGGSITSHCYFLRGEEGWTIAREGLGRRRQTAGTWATGRLRAGRNRCRIVFNALSIPTTSAGAAAESARSTAHRCSRGAPTMRSGGRVGGRTARASSVHALARVACGRRRRRCSRSGEVRGRVRYARDPNLLDPGGTEVTGGAFLHAYRPRRRPHQRCFATA